jgi:hypothetical protein
MADLISIQDLELKYRRDHAAQMRGHFLRDALKKCVTGEPSKPYEDLDAAKKRLHMINDIVAEALKGL